LSNLAPALHDALAAYVTQLGFRPVRIQLTSGRGRATLQIMAEPLDGSPMMLEHCEHISRLVSPWLDVNDPIASTYTLEVSSPGIDRPLTQPQDFDKYQGHVAVLELVLPQNGQKRFRGVITQVEAGGFVLKVDAQLFSMRFNEIRSAKLVLTDALLDFEQKRAKLPENLDTIQSNDEVVL
jgi:ribosome maturation factor RimP